MRINDFKVLDFWGDNVIEADQTYGAGSKYGLYYGSNRFHTIALDFKMKMTGSTRSQLSSTIRLIGLERQTWSYLIAMSSSTDTKDVF